jgi:regulator of sigma E protease
MNLSLLILGILGFFGLVVAHEWGHFIMAKRNGVEVEEFAIGFPPRLLKRQTRAGWIFTINLLPLGGFVKLKGEHDTDTEPGSMGAASVWGKTQIMAAGVMVNLVLAYLLLVVLAFAGMPQLVPNQFVVASDAQYISRAQPYIATGTVEAGSPAAQAGVKADDKLLSFGPAGHATKLTTESQLPALTKRLSGQSVEITYAPGAGGKLVTRTLTLRSAEQVAVAAKAGRHIGYLGLSVYQSQTGVTVVRSTWSSPIVAAGLVGQFTQLTFQGLGKAVQGVGAILAGLATQNTAQRTAGQAEASSQVSGPIGIFFIFKEGSTLGLRFMLFIIAVLSLTLAIMNILPIPALDGGRLWLMLITRAIKHPLKASQEEAINAAGFAFLMGLLVVISIVDVRRFL